VVCAEGGASLAKMPGGEAWKKRYDAKYPNQFQVYSPYTYDATFVLVDAMKRANSIDPKKYIPELKKTNFKGVTTNIAFEPNGELKNPAMTLYVYKDGKKSALNSRNLGAQLIEYFSANKKIIKRRAFKEKRGFARFDRGGSNHHVSQLPVKKFGTSRIGSE
jgi:ABC-type branched-subunit amino acid transport system substrate-binding protein